jgi:acetyl-CoA hydrolase
MQISSNLKKRIKNLNLLSKVTNPTNVLSYFKEIKSPIYRGWSGFTGVGYPKIIPIELANYVEKNNLKGKMKFNIYVGASVGYEVEDRWASLDMIDRLFPYQSGKDIQNGINHGKVKFNDKHLSMFAQDLVYGFYTKDKDSKKLDFSIIEITGITKDGGLIPGLSVGAIPEIIQSSDKVILEINTASPECEGLHDLLYTEEPPNRKPYLIEKVNDRIGKTFLPIDPNKIIAIVESPLHDTPTEVHSDMNCGKMISNHIVEFLQNEVKHNRLPSNLLPIQSGVGNISNAVIGGLVNSPFNNLEVWTEVIQDTFLDFF